MVSDESGDGSVRISKVLIKPYKVIFVFLPFDRVDFVKLGVSTLLATERPELCGVHIINVAPKSSSRTNESLIPFRSAIFRTIAIRHDPIVAGSVLLNIPIVNQSYQIGINCIKCKYRA